MKKIILFLALCLLVAGSSFAYDLADNLVSTALSNKVTGWYYTDAATEASAYTLQTGHSQGNRAFASGSFATTINYQTTTDPTAAIMTGGFDSTEYDSGNTNGWVPVGEKETVGD